MRNLLLSSAAVAAAFAGGCQWLPSAGLAKKDGEAPALTVSPKPGLLIGPGAGGADKVAQELDPKAAAQACLAAAAEMEKKGQPEEAIRLYEKARQDQPSLSQAVSRKLGILYDMVGKFPEAAAEYEVCLKATPNDADLLSDVGYHHYGKNDWAGAEKYLRLAIKAQPAHQRAWRNLGMTLAAQRKWQEGYDAFLMVGKPAEAHCSIAYLMASQGLYDDAKAQYRKALDVDPSNQLARVQLARFEKLAPPGSVVTMAAGGRSEPVDPNKITTVMEHMERLKTEDGKKGVARPAPDAAPFVVSVP